MKSKIESQKKESKEEDSKQEETDEIEEFLVWRPAPAREHSSEGFEVGKVIKAIEAEIEDETDVEEDVAVAANDEDDGKVLKSEWEILLVKNGL